VRTPGLNNLNVTHHTPVRLRVVNSNGPRTHLQQAHFKVPDQRISLLRAARTTALGTGGQTNPPTEPFGD